MLPPLRAGETHDVVVWVNNSIQLGLTVAPGSFRQTPVPSLASRMPQGEWRGLDRGRWKSWIQYRFDGGAGQLRWHGSQGNARFAESSLIDIGAPLTALGTPVSKIPVPAVTDQGMPPEDSPVGDISVAMLPVQTTGESYESWRLFTNRFPVHIVEHSFRPHLIHWLTAAVYTFPVGDTLDPYRDGILAGDTDPLAGKWAVMHTGLAAPVLSVTRFSGVVMMAQGAVGIQAYGPLLFTTAALPGILQPTRCTWYVPAYSTGAQVVNEYDGKLWRADGHNIAYLRPVSGTWNATWTDYMPLGEGAEPITNLCVAFGREYVGKTGSLWVWESGRVYMIEDFSGERDPNNFKMMVVYRGNMYFNVRQRVYRLTSAGVLELLQTPAFDGVVTGGAVVQDELHINIMDPSSGGRVLIFNAESGGTRQWFQSGEVAIAQPNYDPMSRSVVGAFGLEWLAPMYMTKTYNTVQSFPVVAVNRISRRRTRNPFADQGYMIMSLQDVGIPNLRKFFNRIVTDYYLYDAKHKIDVYYLPELQSPRVIEADSYGWGGGLNEWWLDGSLIDGDLTTSYHIGAVLQQTKCRVGFAAPPAAVAFDLLSKAAGLSNLRITIGGDVISDWLDVIETTAAGGPLRYKSPPLVQDGTNIFRQSGVVYFPRSIRETWKPASGSEGGHDFPMLYWLEIQCATGVDLYVHEISTKPEDLLQQDWQYLGTLADLTESSAALSFPMGFKSKEIGIMFKAFGSDVSRPEIRQVELEWLPEESNLVDHHMAVRAVDNLKRLDGQIENSAAFIHATLWSMHGSGAPQIVEVPWPTRHTTRAKVVIASPGVNVPILAYNTIHPSGADFPIVLQEL